MRRSVYTDSQIIGFLREADEGASIAWICKTAGISRRTFYRWRAQFGALEPAEARRMRALESENRRLRHMLDDIVRLSQPDDKRRPMAAAARSDVGAGSSHRPMVIGRYPSVRISPHVR